MMKKTSPEKILEIPFNKKEKIFNGKENQQDNSSVPTQEDEKDFNPTTEKYTYPINKILPTHKRLTPENSPIMSRRSGSPGQRRKMLPTKEISFDIGHLLPDLSEDSDYHSSSEDVFNSPKFNAPKHQENLIKRATSNILNQHAFMEDQEDTRDKEFFYKEESSLPLISPKKPETSQKDETPFPSTTPRKNETPQKIEMNEKSPLIFDSKTNNGNGSEQTLQSSNIFSPFSNYAKTSFQIFNHDQKWNSPLEVNLPSSNGLGFESKYNMNFKQEHPQQGFLPIHNNPPSPTRYQTFNPEYYPNLLTTSSHLNTTFPPMSSFPQNIPMNNPSLISPYYSPIKQPSNSIPQSNMMPLVNKRASVCRYFLIGQCIRGNSCNFLHSTQPTPKPETIITKTPPPVTTTLKKPSNITTIDESIGHIYYLCKDQQGCRFLQKKIEEETEVSVPIIFSEIYQHFAELMVDPFGNYLCQKLLDHCSETQRLQIIESVGTELVLVAQNMHGTRAVQKLIECLTLPQQIDKIIEAFNYNVVPLIQDLNGNHVIQRCLNKLSSQDNQFIYDAVTKSCVEVATHRHGCCVLQRCIDFASESQKKQLIDEIISNALILVQDPYGNYVTQYVLELNLDLCKANLISKFQGNIVRLSTQKFSSNVVEKCLQLADKKHKKIFLNEIINTKNLGNLLQDPYANYVIQTALTVSDPQQYRLLVEKIKPFLPSLRHTPHGRRILKNCNKKI